MLQNEYDEAFQRVAQAADEYLAEVSREAEAAKLLLPTLLEKSTLEGEASLSDPRYHSRELVRLLLARSHGLRLTEPVGAIKAASLAVMAADRLAASRYGTSLVEEVRAQAWAYLGNSLRILGELRRAATALRIATEHLVAAGCDPLLEAEILSMTASLRDSEGQPAKALPLIERARVIYRAAGDRLCEARALSLKGVLLGDAHQYRKAISSIRKGMALVALEDEPALVLGLQHNLLYYFAMRGRPRKALDLLTEKRSLYIELGNWPLLLRLRWLDGFIARQLGDLTASESVLWLVRDGFLERGIELDAALATLDIAEICCLQGRGSYSKRLTAEAIPVLESYGAVQQAKAARRFFAKAGS